MIIKVFITEEEMQQLGANTDVDVAKIITYDLKNSDCYDEFPYPDFRVIVNIED